MTRTLPTILIGSAVLVASTPLVGETPAPPMRPTHADLQETCWSYTGDAEYPFLAGTFTYRQAPGGEETIFCTTVGSEWGKDSDYWEWIILVTDERWDDDLPWVMTARTIPFGGTLEGEGSRAEEREVSIASTEAERTDFGIRLFRDWATLLPAQYEPGVIVFTLSVEGQDPVVWRVRIAAPDDERPVPSPPSRQAPSAHAS